MWAIKRPQHISRDPHEMSQATCSFLKVLKKTNYPGINKYPNKRPLPKTGSSHFVINAMPIMHLFTYYSQCTTLILTYCKKRFSEYLISYGSKHTTVKYRVQLYHSYG